MPAVQQVVAVFACGSGSTRLGHASGVWCCCINSSTNTTSLWADGQAAGGQQALAAVTWQWAGKGGLNCRDCKRRTAPFELPLQCTLTSVPNSLGRVLVVLVPPADHDAGGKLQQ